MEKHKFLFLEDDPYDVEIMAHELETEGHVFDYHSVDNEYDFISALANYKPDLVISDYNLPGYDGLQALKYMKKNYPGIPVVFVTGTMSEEIAADSIKAGAWDYVVKERLSRISPAIKNSLALKEEKQAKLDALEELQESEKKLRNLFDASIDGIILTDEHFNILDINPIVTEKLCIPADQIIGKNARQILTELSKEEYEYLEYELKKGKQKMIETRFINAKGEKIFVEISSKLIDLGRSKAILNISREITERKMFEKEKIRAIIDTEEKERTRFSRDIHDGLGALLSSLGLYVNILKHKKLEKNKQEEVIKNMEEILNECITTSRQVAKNMMPSIVKDFGLIKAIDSFCRKIVSTGDYSIQFDPSTEIQEINEDAQVIIYRVITELINNTIKHSNASKINIELINEKKHLKVYYQDNGDGFSIKQKLKEPGGSGVKNIISRINFLNGKYYQLEQGEGFKFVFNVPYN